MKKNSPYKRFHTFKSIKKVFSDKCLQPRQTVDWIIELFRRYFKDNEFEITHSEFQSPLSKIWSTLSYIRLNNSPILITGGKGISLELALASGYAELMERLQIGYSFSRNPYKPVVLPYYKNDDVNNNTLEIDKIFEKALRDNNQYLPDWKDYTKVFIPYIDVKKMETILIENRFLLDATGCTAGNTYEEAFLQGLCEIFERYTAGYVLLNKIKCPTIPIKNLSTEYQTYIKNLKRNKIHAIVKDLSLNKQIPSAGILFYHEDLDVYEFRAGSATTLDVAVQRCLTETMQIWALSVLKEKIISSNIFEIAKGHMRRIEGHFSKARKLYETFPEINEYLPFRYFITMGFPRHSFYPSKELEFLAENNGEFNMWNYFNEDLNREVEYLLKLCEDNNWHVYIRDYNWLGFPALKVFVPELAFGYYEFKKFETKELYDLKKNLLTNIDLIKAEDLKILKTSEFLIYCVFNSSLAKFFKIEAKTLEKISVWEFFGLLAIARGEKELAKLYWKQDFSKISNKLKLFKNKNEIITYLKTILPNCTESCSICKFKNECKYINKKAIEKRIFQDFPQLFKRHIINQRFAQF